MKYKIKANEALFNKLRKIDPCLASIVQNDQILEDSDLTRFHQEADSFVKRSEETHRDNMYTLAVLVQETMKYILNSEIVK
jgi:hypothetical protein